MDNLLSDLFQSELFVLLLDGNTIFTPKTLAHYAEGLVTTVQLVFLSLVVGVILAVPLVMLRVSNNLWLSRPVWFYTYLFRGTPLLIQLYIIYYGLAMIEGIQQTIFWYLLEDPFYPALLAFALNSAAYTIEIFRGAILSVPEGEVRAAVAFGMSRGLILRRIIFPNAFRRAIPAYSNEVIFMLHASSIASVVTILDLTGAARDIYAKFYAPFEAFLFVALLYLLLTFGIIALFRRLEKRMLAHLNIS